MAVDPIMVVTILDVLARLAARYPAYRDVWNDLRKKEGITDAEWQATKDALETHRPNFSHPDDEGAPV